MPEKVEVEVATLRGILDKQKQLKREFDLLQDIVVALLPSYERERGPARIEIPSRKHRKGVEYDS